MPAELVAEVHLAGHSADPKLGAALLIDSHDAADRPGGLDTVEHLIARIGAWPTLIERDENVPTFDELRRERDGAHVLWAMARRRTYSRLMELAAFQDAFASALLADDPQAASEAVARLVRQPGFAVYRNTVMKACIDALQAELPGHRTRGR